MIGCTICIGEVAQFRRPSVIGMGKRHGPEREKKEIYCAAKGITELSLNKASIRFQTERVDNLVGKSISFVIYQRSVSDIN